ncbi:MAG: protein kinase [Myxococcota bacterium]
MIGTTLDKYEVLQKVGEGGMATVYRGRHSTLDRDVAIKVLHPHLSSSSRNRLRFAREAKAVERLRHDNILEIFDYSGNDAADCYIVTEFVKGETLTHLLHRTGRMPSEVVARLGVEIARALSYAHHEGILHRDLKTDNVMVRVDGAVKLMDFGIARFLDESQVTMTGALVGSPAFMSPEQAQELILDPRSDLFSLGTVLFYLVTGHLPFSGSNPSLILKNVIEGNRPHVTELAPTMSASLADVIEQLLATSPSDRFVSASAVEEALRACVEETRTKLEDEAWGLRCYVEEPEAYTERLDLHLTRVLADEGQQRLAAGDHLAALRLFNRLLSMDEDNEEVLALVQNLHGSPPSSAARWRWVPVVALALLAVGGVVAWTMWRDVAETPAVQKVAAAKPLIEMPAQSDNPPPVPRIESQGPPVEPVDVEAVAAPAEVREEAVAVKVAPKSPRVRAGAREADRAVTRLPSRMSVPRNVASEAAPAEPLGFGTLWVDSGDDMAEVWIGNRKVGNVREPITVASGSYDLIIRSQFTKVHVEPDVRIAPDERNVVSVALTLKPRRVHFVGWPDACQVIVNGEPRNTVAGLQRYWHVQQPKAPLEIAIRCPDGRGDSRDWPFLLEDQRFEAPRSPG